MSWENLPYGTYRVTEPTRTGWNSPDTISDAYAISTPNESNSLVAFTFTNTPFGSLQAKKVDNAGNVVSGWSMTLRVKDTGVWRDATSADLISGTITNPKLTDVNGLVSWENLRYGTYRVIEATRTGWDSPDTISDEFVIDTPNESNTLVGFTFTNTPFGSLQAKKVDNAGNVVSGWSMTLRVKDTGVWRDATSADLISGTITNPKLTDVNGLVSWENLRYGTYRVIEATRTGWDSPDTISDEFVIDTPNESNTLVGFTFTNTPFGSLQAKKVDNAGNVVSGWSMTLRVKDTGVWRDATSADLISGTITNPKLTDVNGLVSWENLRYGTYRVIEATRTGWDSPDTISDEFVIDTPNESNTLVGFTFTNTPFGSLQAKKVDNAGNVVSGWSMTLRVKDTGVWRDATSADLISGTITNPKLTDVNGLVSWENLRYGTYRVIEATRTGWDSPDTISDEFVIDTPNESNTLVGFTFTNTPFGSLQAKKVDNAGNVVSGWSMTLRVKDTGVWRDATSADLISGTITNPKLTDVNGLVSWENLRYGTYRVIEATRTGWDSPDTISDEFVIDTPNESNTLVGFTFTNTPFGSLQAKKVDNAGNVVSGWSMTLRVKDTGVWRDATSADLISGTITNPKLTDVNGLVSWENLRYGTYRVIEATRTGWDSPDTISDEFVIDTPNESNTLVGFTFTNTPFGSLQAKKVDNAGNVVSGWSMTLRVKDTGVWRDATSADLISGTITNPKLTDVNGLVSWENLRYGTYRVIEATRTGWDSPDTISDEFVIDTPNESNTLVGFTFTNTPFGSLQAKKVDNAGNVVSGWSMTLRVKDTGVWRDATSADLISGTITNPKLTDVNGLVSWENLRYGTYRVIEATRTGWDSPDTISDEFVIDTPNESNTLVGFTFTNTPFGSLQAKKVDNAGNVVSGWSMTLRVKDTGVWRDATSADLISGTITNPKLTDVNGLVSWENLRYGTYRVIEATRTGWDSPETSLTSS